jgi:hypothetical protein
MSSSADDDIISLNFRYRNEENKNIIFALEISKDKHVSDLEKEIRKKLGPIVIVVTFSIKFILRRSLCGQKIGFFPILMRRLMKMLSTSEFSLKSS